MLDPLKSPEIIFGICSPIGVDNRRIVDAIKSCLKYYNYDTHILKITELMKTIDIDGYDLRDRPIEAKYDSYIKYANKIREIFVFPGVLSALACAAIRDRRREINKKIGKDTESYLELTAYIIDQLKRPEEVKLLRQVYGRLFILISAYSDEDVRVEVISNKIASDHGDGRPSNSDISAARVLVSRDQDESEVSSGQRLRDAFALADVFVDVDDASQAEHLIGRFLKGFFGSNSISPTRDEYGMYAAKGASLRSMDLSRQVGAAIFSVDGEVVTQGSNEVPKYGGGTYWAGDACDGRDYMNGRDENERIKRSLLINVVRTLKKGGYFKDDYDDQDLTNMILDESYKSASPLRETQIMDLLEFGRIIHAEMSAICDAARTGRSIKGTTLYCTTFPCHICSKHIVASGIGRVVYIEPYPKSYAAQLHPDSISVGKNGEVGKVVFSPFIGISPFRYREIFERGKRKDQKGEFQKWSDLEPRPLVRYTIANWLENEIAVTKYFGDLAGGLIGEGKITLTNAGNAGAMTSPNEVQDYEIIATVFAPDSQ